MVLLMLALRLVQPRLGWVLDTKKLRREFFRSADDVRQFRMTNADLLPTHGNMGSHVHFEALNASGRVIENLHLPVG